jgi:hypothetical protein
MAKGKKSSSGPGGDNDSAQTKQSGIISGAATAVGSVVGAVAAVTDFVSTQVRGEPIFAGSKSKKTAKKTGAKKAGSKKASTAKSGKSKASLKKSPGKKSVKAASKKAAKKAGAKKR